MATSLWAQCRLRSPLYRLLRRRSKKASKLRVTGLCVPRTKGTREMFPWELWLDGFFVGADGLERDIWRYPATHPFTYLLSIWVMRTEELLSYSRKHPSAFQFGRPNSTGKSDLTIFQEVESIDYRSLYSWLSQHRTVCCAYVLSCYCYSWSVLFTFFSLGCALKDIIADRFNILLKFAMPVYA